MNYVEYDYNRVALFHNEVSSLRLLRSNGSLPVSMISNFSHLREADLVDYDQGNDRDAFNHSVPLDTVHITDKGLRYLAWRRVNVLRSIVTPIIVTAITTIGLYILQHWLIPTVISLFQG